MAFKSSRLENKSKRAVLDHANSLTRSNQIMEKVDTHSSCFSVSKVTPAVTDRLIRTENDAWFLLRPLIMNPAESKLSFMSLK